jgi:CHRD domain-containing protein
MKRLAGVAAALLMAAACGSDNNTPPTNPSNNTGPITFTANLAAANEVPAVQGAEANAAGTATITMNVTRDAATGNITGGGTLNFSASLRSFPGGTAINAAHIHAAPAGQNAGVFIGVTGISAATPVVMDGSGAGAINVSNVAVTQDQATQIFNNPAGFYFNVHTTANSGGAARGQLTKQ